MKYHKNLSDESDTVSCGRSDGHDEANTHFSQLFGEHS